MAATTMSSVVDGSTHQNPRGFTSFERIIFTATYTTIRCVHNFGQHRNATFTAQNVMITLAPLNSFTVAPIVRSFRDNHITISNVNSTADIQVKVYAQALHPTVE